MQPHYVLGIMGLCLLFLAYGLALFGKLDQDSWNFGMLNLTGAMLLVYYTYLEGAFLFSVLLLVWGLFAIINMIKGVVRK